MAKTQAIEALLKNGSAAWNKLRNEGKVPLEHTGATFKNLFSAGADLSGLILVGSEWENCDLSKVNFREADLSNAYLHGGQLQECDFRGANLEGATIERVKLLRCDFSGARGLEDLELEGVHMDRVVGLGGAEAPPPPAPAHGVTSFTREQRNAALANAAAEQLSDLPPFRPQDPPGTLLVRGLKSFGSTPLWVLDAPGLRPPLPAPSPAGASLESLYREAVRTRLENRKPLADAEVVKRAQKSLRLGARDAAHAAMYLREVSVEPEFRFSAAKALKEAMRAELEIDDLTASIDPRTAGGLLELRLPHGATEYYGEARRRLAAARLFSALLEAGFHPDNNWQEAVDASEAAIELSTLATAGDRIQLEHTFRAFAGLPEEGRLRRLAYLAEATSHLEALGRLPAGIEPAWLQEPESRECHDKEMRFLQTLRAEEIPQKVAALAQAELGVPSGSVPEDSEGDLFIHFRCSVCGKEKLLVQSA